jgi:signal transduction histidine kinase
VSEHEHQRIGQDLHDGICQQLAAVGCAVHALAEDLRSRSDPGAADAELIGRSLQQAMKDARQLAQGILPVHVGREGLAAALRRLAQTMTVLTGAQVRLVDDPGFPMQDSGIAMHLYRIAQEAVANAIRHGEAQNVTICLRVEPSFQELRIDDDGRGFAPQCAPLGTGMGLRTMHYRAQAIPGCSLSFVPLSPGGTSVRCRFATQAT